MKSHSFPEAIKTFNQLLLNLYSSHSKNSSVDQTPTLLTTESHYLTGVCYFHLG